MPSIGRSPSVGPGDGAPKRAPHPPYLTPFGAIAAALAVAACAPSHREARLRGSGAGGSEPSEGDGGSAGAPVSGSGGNTITVHGTVDMDDGGPKIEGPTPVVACSGPCTDFPAMPLLGGDAGGGGLLPADVG